MEYMSQARGIGGELSGEAEDFFVEEITKDGTVLGIGEQIQRKDEEGGCDFIHFVLQKKNWNTLQAIKEIAKNLRVSSKRFGYAGNKDRKTVSTQLTSVFKCEESALLATHVKDIKINGAWRAKKKIEIGDLLGNRFMIRIRNMREAEPSERVREIYDELGGVFPNYFGAQRFGSVRANTHLVGREIVKGNFRSAVMNYLAYVGEDEEEMEEARRARRELAETNDFKLALKNFPPHLKYERVLLHHLSEHPNDYVSALRRLPRGLSLLFVHAYQSHLFNELLGERVGDGLEFEEGDVTCGENFRGFPDVENARAEKGGKFLVGRTIGYETKPNGRERALLEREEISTENFRIKSFPQLSSKGATRALRAPLKDFSFEFEESRDAGVFRFSIPAGAYATVALREFLDEKI
ncbi:MAG: tRNA pseudouridine(13) synthase TruD [Candidatus Micrarchaeota archaeon]